MQKLQIIVHEDGQPLHTNRPDPSTKDQRRKNTSGRGINNLHRNVWVHVTICT